MLGKCCAAELHPEPQILHNLKTYLNILFMYVYVYMSHRMCVEVKGQLCEVFLSGIQSLGSSN